MSNQEIQKTTDYENWLQDRRRTAETFLTPATFYLGIKITILAYMHDKWDDYEKVQREVLGKLPFRETFYTFVWLGAALLALSLFFTVFIIMGTQDLARITKGEVVVRGFVSKSMRINEYLLVIIAFTLIIDICALMIPLVGILGGTPPGS